MWVVHHETVLLAERDGNHRAQAQRDERRCACAGHGRAASAADVGPGHARQLTIEEGCDHIVGVRPADAPLLGIS